MSDEGPNRRDLLRAGVGATLAAPLAGLAASARAGATPITQAGLFLNAAEMALLDELAEMIVPADEHSGGARAAGVAVFIDEQLAAKDPAIPDWAQERELFRSGLARIDELARARYGATFLETEPAERLALLTRIAEGEADPGEPEERFFVELKRQTVIAYYSSEIGLHDDIEYKGNTTLRRFVGTDVSKR